MARLLMITVTVVFKTLPRMNMIGIILNQFVHFHAIPMAFVLNFSVSHSDFLAD